MASLLASLFCTVSLCREIVVDLSGHGDFTEIAQAVEAANGGDIVTIRSGTYLETIRIFGKKCTEDKPLVIRADPAVPTGSVIIDGSRPVPAEAWKLFISERCGIRAERNVYSASHNPETDSVGDELRQSAWPYRLVYSGYYGWDGKTGGPNVTGRWGTTQVFQGTKRLQIVPSHPKAGKTADSKHADSEETQSEEYLTAGNPKFLQPGQWIWYDDGRTDGADKDEIPVPHPDEIRNRIFIRLDEGGKPLDMAYSARITGILIDGCTYLTVKGIAVRRAMTGVDVRVSRHISLQNVTVEEFGGGRKFRASLSNTTNERIWEGGGGILTRNSIMDITGCLVQNGVGAALGSNGTGEEKEDNIKIIGCTFRNISAHPWGGGWAHGKGEGINVGNHANVLITRCEFRDLNGCGIWIDNEPDSGYCRNLRIIDNAFIRCRDNGVFAELWVDQVLIALNRFEEGGTGVCIGPVARRARIVGNLFLMMQTGVTARVFSRTQGRTDTVDYFTVAGNIFAECKRNLVWSTLSLPNPHKYVDYNIWHVPSESTPFVIGDKPVRNYEEMWKRIPSDTLIASGKHDKIVTQNPFDSGVAGKRFSASLVTAELLDDLVSRAALSEEDRNILENWRKSP